MAIRNPAARMNGGFDAHNNHIFLNHITIDGKPKNSTKKVFWI